MSEHKVTILSDIGVLVGERIRTIRKKRGLSQENLGNLCNLHPKYISSIERAEKNVSLEAINKIASAFNMSLEDLFRNLQPSINNEDYYARQVYNLVYELNLSNQESLYYFVKSLIKWKND